MRQQAEGTPFSYKDSATDRTRFSTIPAEEFIRRFLQNVLPKGFVKVRYYGLLAASNRHLLDQARQLLTTAASIQIPQTQIASGKIQASLLAAPSAERP